MALHPALSRLGWLIGRWQGTGCGSYTAIPEFKYTETVKFGHCGKPFLTYHQRTAHATEKTPLHAEDGFWKVRPGTDQVALTIAENIGIAEVLEGTISEDGHRICVTSTSIHGPTFGKEPRVTQAKRVYEKDGDQLKIYFWMATATTPDLKLHLESTLERVASEEE